MVRAGNFSFVPQAVVSNRSKMPHKEDIDSVHNSESSGSCPMQPAASQLIPMAARLALWEGRELAGLTLVSLLAGTATIPYIAYHFHRISAFAVVANLLAMPAVLGWAMPWALLDSSSAFADFFNPSPAPPP
jgi:Competence protein